MDRRTRGVPRWQTRRSDAVMQQVTARLLRHGREDTLGVAWLCSAHYAVTAAHCVGDREARQLYQGPFRLEFPPRTIASGATTIHLDDVVRCDFDLDVALLALKPEDAARLAATVHVTCGALPRLSPWPTPDAAPGWQAFGFPVAKPTGIAINGSVDDPHGNVDGSPAIQLTCEQGGEGFLEGVSGSAVSCNGTVVGLIRWGPPLLQQRVIYATALEEVGKQFPEIDSLLIENRLRTALDGAHPDRLAFILLKQQIPDEEGPTVSDSRTRPEKIVDGLRRRPGRAMVELLDALQQAPKRSADPARSSNVPAQQPPIGRASTIAAIVAHLQPQQPGRLLTLTGVPGVGKTRVGLRAAEELVPAFANGVLFVDCSTSAVPAATAGPEEVLLSRMALALQRIEPQFKTVRDRDSVQAYLRDKEMLVFIDSVDAVLGAAPLIARLLSDCLRLKVLTTSQVPVGSVSQGAGDWEKSLEVRPFATPDPDHLPPFAELAGEPCIQLFVAVAGTVRKGGFELTEADAAPIAAICARLDGLPLAIRLAASQSASQEPDEILADLPDEAEPRILDAIFDVSYVGLTADEQHVFRRMSVFVGGFTSAAARSFCRGAPVVRCLNALVHKSLIEFLASAVTLDGKARYRMLPTVRRFALNRLTQLGEAGAVQRAFAHHWLEWSEEAAGRLTSRDRGPGRWLDRVDAEQDNLRAALRWSREPGNEPELGLRLAGNMFWYWNLRGYFAEGLSHYEAGLALSTPATVTHGRAHALYGAGGLYFLVGDYDHARTLLRESVAAWQQLGEERRRGYALVILGMVALEQNSHDQLDESRQHLEGGRRLLESTDQWGHALALNDLGRVVDELEGYEAAAALFKRSLAAWADMKDDWGRPLTLNAWGVAALNAGRHEDALKLLTDALKVQIASKDGWGQASSYRHLGILRVARGEYKQAATALAESIRLHRVLGRKQMVNRCLEALAGLAAAMSRGNHAAVLFGAAEALREEIRSPIPPRDRKPYDASVAAARTTASSAPEHFEACWNRGRALNSEEATAEALRLVEAILEDRVSSFSTGECA